jgi:hypothetical protein
MLTHLLFLTNASFAFKQYTQIANTVAGAPMNKVYLNADTLLLNGLGDTTEPGKKKIFGWF